jgi:hypothetical protein
MNRAAAVQRRARRLPPAAFWDKRFPSKGFGREPDSRRIAAVSARNRALATSVSPASSAMIAASMASRRAAGVVPLATLLHASDSRALSHAFSDPPASPQDPDSSPEAALRIAPTFSATMTGPCSTPDASTKPSDIAEAIGRRTRVALPGLLRLKAVPQRFIRSPSLPRTSLARDARPELPRSGFVRHRARLWHAPARQLLSRAPPRRRSPRRRVAVARGRRAAMVGSGWRRRSPQ